MDSPTRLPVVSLALLLGALVVFPSSAYAQEASHGDSASVASVHPVLAALGSLLGARLNPAERVLLVAIDARDTEAGSVQALLLAALDRLRPAVSLSFEAAGYDAPEIARVRAMTVHDAADALALARALESAAAEATRAADAQDDASAYSDNTLRVAAGIATQVSRLADAIAAGVSDATDEDLADCDGILDDVAAVLDDATVLVGRRAAIRLGFQVYRGAVMAMHGPMARLRVAPTHTHLAGVPHATAGHHG